MSDRLDTINDTLLRHVADDAHNFKELQGVLNTQTTNIAIIQHTLEAQTKFNETILSEMKTSRDEITKFNGIWNKVLGAGIVLVGLFEVAKLLWAK